MSVSENVIKCAKLQLKKLLCIFIVACKTWTIVLIHINQSTVSRHSLDKYVIQPQTYLLWMSLMKSKLLQHSIRSTVKLSWTALLKIKDWHSALLSFDLLNPSESYGCFISVFLCGNAEKKALPNIQTSSPHSVQLKPPVA